MEVDGVHTAADDGRDMHAADAVDHVLPVALGDHVLPGSDDGYPFQLVALDDRVLLVSDEDAGLLDAVEGADLIVPSSPDL